MIDVDHLLSDAVRHFWRTRSAQRDRQGSKSGSKDAGERSAVTGGKHADGFVRLIAAIVENAELPNWKLRVHTTVKKHRTLPGYFRPCKEWDVVVLSDNDLIAVVEVKSQVGSFGNNFNTRVEEALGNASDFWMAYSKGIFAPSTRPWLGYLFMLEERAASLRSTKSVRLEPYAVDQAFQELSYADRYQLVCSRMVRERLYDSACFFTSTSTQGMLGKFAQPNAELSIRNFAVSLHSRAAAFAKVK